MQRVQLNVSHRALRFNGNEVHKDYSAFLFIVLVAEEAVVSGTSSMSMSLLSLTHYFGFAEKRKDREETNSGGDRTQAL